MVPIPKSMRATMAIVIGVSVPEGLALLLGPASWFPHIWIWGPPLNPMSARFIGGLYLAVALGFAMAWRATEWEATRIPLAMLWLFALVALVAAAVSVVTDPSFIHLDRPFSYVWVFLYAVSVAGGLYFHLVYPRKFGAKPF